MGLLDTPSYSRGQADSRFLASANPVGLIPGPVIASHSMISSDTAPGGTAADAGVGMFSRSKHYAQYSATDLRLVYSNYCIGTGDQSPTNAIKVKVSVEIPIGTYFPVQFPGTDVNGYVHIQPGCFVVSNPLSIDVTTGDIFFVNTNVAPDVGGGTFPVGMFNARADSNWEYRIPNTTTDYTGSLPPSGNTDGLFYGPNAITGRPTALSGKRPPQVFLWGDSIMNGSGDTTWATWGLAENGWVRQALNNTIPFVYAARSGTGALNFTTNTKRRCTASLMTGCTHAIEAFGANDFGVDTLTNCRNARLNLWKMMANRGIKVYATTVTPRTDSTDSWATTTNQTVKAWEGNRTTFNDWLRAGAPLIAGAPVTVGTTGALLTGQPGHPLVGYIDTADVLETSRNSGKWKVNGTANYATSDGLHPKAVMHALMAATVPVSAFVPS